VPGRSWNAAALTAVQGSFSWPEEAACRGSYYLSLAPETAVAEDEVISPLDAGSGRPWIVERGISIAQGQFCGGAFAAGAVGCQDRFVVSSIRQVAAP
jgi:hypothetical protein